MNPQQWIEEANKRWRWPHGEFAQEGAQHLAAALAEISRLRSEVDALRAGVAAQILPMENAPKTGEHIIVFGQLTGIGFGYSGPNNSRQSWADVVHWYPGWADGGELPGWYSSSYGGDQKEPFQEDLMRGWMRIPEGNAHSVPASRVLKEGEVAVTRAELAPLRIIANHFSRGDREWILEYTVPVEMALDALDALRSQEGGAR